MSTLSTKYFFPAVCTFICLISSSCRNHTEALSDTDILKADSISIRLNSPELKAVNAALLNDPGNHELMNRRARVYLSLKEFKEAENDAKRAIKVDSTKADYYMTLVDVYFSENKTRLAKELLLIMEQKFPEHVETLLKLSELHFLVMKYQEAINYINRALKIDEHHPNAYFIKGSIYRESGDTARAISSLETAIEQDNKFEDAYYDLGVIFAARKNPFALQYYDNVLRINSGNEKARYAKAKMLQDLGKIDEAIPEYEQIIKNKPECEICYYNLGAIYLEIKKDNKKALEYFTKAIEANPSYAEAYFARGYTYSKLNNKESAKADYNLCLKLIPNYEPAIRGLNEIK
jgi:tetratricopeptide (TPR) repeat protein